MVPGITETEYRIAQFRYRELHAKAERQRRAATACAHQDRGEVTETLQRHVGVLTAQVSQFLQRVRTQEASEHAAAPGALAVSK